MTNPLSPAAQSVLNKTAQALEMTNSLSPAAQAVLDAACDSLDRRGYISDQVAAALRAAAQFNPGPFVPELFGEGWHAAMGELRNIADELEPKDLEALDD